MNPEQHQDGGRHQRFTLSTGSGKTSSFIALMERLGSRTAEERTQLQAQADAAVLGHEAYALGHEYLERGDYVAAKRWLRVAADRSVPGAEQALEEIDVRQRPIDDSADLTAAPVPKNSGACSTSAPRFVANWGSSEQMPGGEVDKGAQPWASVMDHLVSGTVTAAQATAQKITAQARRSADDLLANTRREIRREWAGHTYSVAMSRRAIARLLLQAQQEREAAREISDQASCAADALLSQAQEQAQGIIENAQARSQAGTGPSKDIKTRSSWRMLGLPDLSECKWQVMSSAVSEAYSRAADENRLEQSLPHPERPPGTDVHGSAWATDDRSVTMSLKMKASAELRSLSNSSEAGAHLYEAVRPNLADRCTRPVSTWISRSCEGQETAVSWLVLQKGFSFTIRVMPEEEFRQASNELLKSLHTEEAGNTAD